MRMGEKFASFADFEGLDELTVCRRLAKQIVDNVIEKATEEVAKVQYEIKSTKFTGKRPASLQLCNLTPSIQIDLVPSRTPTPEEQEQDNSVWIEQQQATKQKRKIRVRIIEEEDEEQLAEEKQVKKKEETPKEKNKKENVSEIVNQKSNSNENKGNSTNKKKTSVSNEKDVQITKEVRTQFVEDSLNNNTKKVKDKNEQKSNQILSNESKSNAKINSIKFDSSIEPNNHNDRRRSSLEKFNEKNEINWPNYDDNEINKIATRFVDQIVEDAKKEVEMRLKPSTSRTSGLYIEDQKSKPNYQPWSLARVRGILSKLMRSTCSLCKNGPTHSTTSGSLADHV